MKTLGILKCWYGWVAVLSWCLPFVIPGGTMLVSLVVRRDLAGPWMGWSSLASWVWASCWSFAVVPWLHAFFEIRGDAAPSGRPAIRRWTTSSIVGVLFSAFPLTALTVIIYLMEYGAMYEPQWGAEEKRLALILGLTMGGIVAVLFFRTRLDRQLSLAYRERRYCFGCGYNLNGQKHNTCSECGEVFAVPGE